MRRCRWVWCLCGVMGLWWLTHQSCYLDPEWTPEAGTEVTEPHTAEPSAELSVEPSAEPEPGSERGRESDRGKEPPGEPEHREPLELDEPPGDGGEPSGDAHEPLEPPEFSEPPEMPRESIQERPDALGPGRTLLQLTSPGDVLTYAVKVARRPSDLAPIVYVYGYFVGSVRFGRQPGAPTLQMPSSCASCPGLFVAQFDASLRYQWSVLLATLQGRAVPRQIQRAAIGPQGVFLVTGDFEGSATFYTGARGSTTPKTYKSRGATDAFVAWIQPDGRISEVVALGDKGPARGVAIAADASGQIYLAGTFSQSVAFGAVQLTSAGREDGFVLKLDAQRRVVWAKGVQGPADEQIQDLVYEPIHQALYLVGSYGINGKAGDQVSIVGQTHQTAYANGSVFLARLSASGSLAWRQLMPGPSQDYGRAVTVSNTGKSHVLASFLQQVFTTNASTLQRCISPTALRSFSRCDLRTSTKLRRDLLLSQLHEPSTGPEHTWSLQVSTTASMAPTSMVLDLAGNLYVTGGLRGDVSLPAPGQPQPKALKASAGEQLFLLSYDRNAAQLRSATTMDGTLSGRGMGLATDSFGGVYVVGYFEGKGTLNGTALQSQGGRDSILWKP